MPEFLDIYIAREWGCSPESVRAWPIDDARRAIALMDAEGRAFKARQ